MRMPISWPHILALAGALLLAAPAAAVPATSGCLACHDRAGFEKRYRHQPVARTLCLACHLPHASRYPGLLLRPEPGLCLTCHQQIASALERRHVHSPIRRQGCTPCHAPHAAPRPALLSDRPGRLCRGCHALADQDGRQHFHPPARGQCLACHDPHAAGDPDLLRQTGDGLCLSCHETGRLRKTHPGSGPEPRGCLSCHDPHASPQASLLRRVVHPPLAEGCDTCHEGDTPVPAATCLACHEEIGDEAGKVHTHLTAPPGSNACVQCHSPHAGDTPTMLRAGLERVCAACHPGIPARYQGQESSHALADATCTDCHEAHGSNRLAMLRADGNAICSQCHETQGTFSHPVGEGVADPRTGQPLTCLTCHDPKGSPFPYQLLADPRRDLCIPCHHY